MVSVPHFPSSGLLRTAWGYGDSYKKGEADEEMEQGVEVGTD